MDSFDGQSLIKNMQPAIQAMREGRTQDYMLNPVATIALYDALEKALNRVVDLEAELKRIKTNRMWPD